MVPVLMLRLLLLPSWKQDVGTRTNAACLSVRLVHHLLSAASRSALRGVRSRVRVLAYTNTICMCATSCYATCVSLHEYNIHVRYLLLCYRYMRAAACSHSAVFVSAASSACEIFRGHFNLMGNRTTETAFHGVLPHRDHRIHRLFPCFFSFSLSFFLPAAAAVCLYHHLCPA